jgi:hypothetical protein
MGAEQFSNNVFLIVVWQLIINFVTELCASLVETRNVKLSLDLNTISLIYIDIFN